MASDSGLSFTRDVAVIGGCGRAGLPLGLVLADRGRRVVLYDRNAAAVDAVNRGELPFREPGAAVVLRRVLQAGFEASADAAVISTAECLVVAVGTAVDEHLNPDPDAIPRLVEELAPYIVTGQLLVLRSTVYPGVTALVGTLASRLGLDIDVAFCPERTSEGNAIRELEELPQILSGTSEHAVRRAERLFSDVTNQFVWLEPEEAELAKLFTNTWRYIRFAIANQLYVIANDFGLDYEQIRAALTLDYPRAADLPRAGFAAGPCLLKDTMQLAAFNNNNFVLGQAAMMINEGLPLYVVSRIERRFELSEMTVGILGMAFKAESDDARSSLSYKLKRILRFKARSVLTTDPFVRDDPSLMPLDEVLDRADLLIVGAAHRAYQNLDTDIPVIDVWGVLGRGVRV